MFERFTEKAIKVIMLAQEEARRLGHITAVAVDPDRRRSGLGGVLLKALLQRARQQGAVHATLEVASDNVAALALYARNGFSTAGTRSGYYSDGRDALIQWCRIPLPTSPTSG